MRPEHLFTTLASFALTWSIGALLAFFLLRQSDRRRPWMYAALSLLMVLAVVWVNSKISLGRNGAVYFIDVLRGGGILHWAAAGLGFCFGLSIGRIDSERFLLPQVKYFSYKVTEKEDEIKSLKCNYTPIRGRKSMSENILTREN